MTEFLAGYELGAPKRWSSLRIAYHAACSMQHGQRIIEEPRELLVKAGFTRDGRFPKGISAAARPEPTTSCSQSSRTQLRDRKVANIERVRARRRSRPATSAASRSWPRHRRPSRAHDRAARLGLRRPRAARARGPRRSGARGTGAKPGPGAKVRRTKLSQPRLGSDLHAHRRAERNQGARVSRRAWRPVACAKRWPTVTGVCRAQCRPAPSASPIDDYQRAGANRSTRRRRSSPRPT